jgi:hypothetical protein
MTFGKASAHALGYAAAVALGIWIGPSVRQAATNELEPRSIEATASAAEEERRPAAVARRNAAAAVEPSAPELQARARLLLNRGADVTRAAEGFRDGEQFMTVAYAARNTGVPFVLLKHRVLEEGDSLTAAIREFKPEIDAQVEAERARAEARSDIAALSGA